MTNKGARTTKPAKTAGEPASPQPDQNVRRDEEPPQSPSPLPTDDLIVVGVGASAGGLEAFSKFFGELSKAGQAAPGMAFVLVQHLEPTHKSMVAELLAAHTSMPVIEAAEGMRIAPGRVYVIPPAAYLTVKAGVLHVEAHPEHRGARMPFDGFLHSLADDFGSRAICIVLTGSGNDGSKGAKAIQDCGGLTIAQDPAEAAHKEMPHNAIATGAIDLTLKIAEMPAALALYAQPLERGDKDPESAAAPEILPEIVRMLSEHTPRDFSLYKKGSMFRQIQRRMATLAVAKHQDYLDMLRSSPAELDLLAKSLLINVTRFFRDPEMYEVLEHSVIPTLIEAVQPGQTLRVWDAGCSTGEETYSVAMMLFERIAASGKNVKLQIFASDIDPDAIAVARNGFYPATIEGDVSAARLGRFFTSEGGGYRVTRMLRESVVFAAHDILADAPFSRLDLVVCRNVFIYLLPETQKNIITLFHFTLREGGVLVLGAAEAINGLEGLFEPISRKQRIFRHIGRRRPGDVHFRVTPPDVTRWSAKPPRQLPTHTQVADIVQQTLAKAYAPASVMINDRLEGLYFFGPVSRYLTVAEGVPSQNILAMANDALRTRLRAAIRQSETENAAATMQATVDRNGTPAMVEITVRPIKIGDDTGCRLVSFVDKPAPVLSVGDKFETGDALLQQELSATRKELACALQDLETASEDLAVVTEEAMSVNEEFQSTNEELETSKEELQSLNEELTALNSQLAETIEQQHATANDLANTLNSAQIAMLFLDTDLCIRFFTPAATAMFRIIFSDIGRPLSDLAQTVKDPDLLDHAKEVLDDHTPLAKDIEGENGKWYNRRVLPYRTQGNEVQGVVITFSDISLRKVAERETESARAYADSVIETIRQPLVILNKDFQVISASPSFFDTLSLRPDAIIGRPMDAICEGHVAVSEVRDFLDSVRNRNFGEDRVIALDLPSRGKRSLRWRANEMCGVLPTTQNILITLDDVTESLQANTALQSAKQLAEQANLGKSRFLAAASHDLRQPMQTLSLLQEMLIKKVSDADAIHLVSKFGETLDVMSGMLNTLLDINQLEAGVVRPEPIVFRIETLLARLGEEFAYHTAAKRIEWRLVNSTVKVRSDPRLLEQMLRNLLSNAVKYTEKGRILIGGRRCGGNLRIEVWDTGVGIPPKELAAIFDEFHQINNPARERSRGLGLGLAIVKRVGDLLGHRTDVRSWSGSGSVFTIEVPIEGNSIPRTGSRNGTQNQIAVPDRSGAILIIEDDPTLREILGMLFEGQGYQTTVVGSAAEALDWVAASAGPPDAIIADYNLPGGITGIEVVGRIRDASGRDVPAIVLTGDISKRTLRKVGLANCIHFRKPARAEVLVRQIEDLLDNKEPQEDRPIDEPASLSAPAPRPEASPNDGNNETVFLVDDDAALLAEMKDVLSGRGFAVETFTSGQAFLTSVGPDRRGCLIVDAVMADMDGFAVLDQIKAERRALSTIVITGYGDVAMAVKAMKAGADDFLEKPVHSDRIAASIKGAMENAGDLTKAADRRQAALKRLAKLTPRERQIMDCIIDGQPNKIIASDLGVSQRTVENHRAAVMRRTGVKSLPDLVRLVMAAK